MGDYVTIFNVHMYQIKFDLIIMKNSFQIIGLHRNHINPYAFVLLQRVSY